MLLSRYRTHIIYPHLCPSFSVSLYIISRPHTDLLLDIRLTANDLRRRIRKCEAEESTQLTRLRQSIRDGRSHISTVHAENVIRQRIELVRLETTLGQLVALADRLKEAIINASASGAQFTGGGAPALDATMLADRQLVQSLLQTARLSAAVAVQPVASAQVEELMASLLGTNEDGLASVASMQQDELMTRLRSLRK